MSHGTSYKLIFVAKTVAELVANKIHQFRYKSNGISLEYYI